MLNTENGKSWEWDLFLGTHKVSGSRVGIVGMGRIGSAIAKRLSAFDVTIGYCNQSKVDNENYLYFSSLVDLASFSDFLVVCVPGIKENFHLINKNVLKALGASGALITISRGSVVDEEYLTGALINKEIRGAALDVLNMNLMSVTNCVILIMSSLTPHMASATWETRVKRWRSLF